MVLNIGEKIKMLRKQQNVTQEKLADYLSISYQAVSKWENGSALPDITLVPGIANFFGVSSDELLGMREDENIEELKQYENMYQENNRLGRVLDNIKLSRKVLAKYPRNYQWMLNLSYALVQYTATKEQEQYSKENGFMEEAISLCEKIREDCTIDSFRQGATQILCYNYPQIGKTDKAIELANEMPEMIISKEALLSRIYTGEEKIKQNQENLIQMIDMCCGIFVELSSDRVLGKDLSFEDKIKFIEASNTLYQTIFQNDEDSLFYACRLCRNYKRLAELWCATGDNTIVMNYLLLAEKTARVYDECSKLGKQKYKSIFANRCTYNPKNSGKNWEGTELSMLYHRTTESVFNNLRDIPEFIELQKRLKQ